MPDPYGAPRLERDLSPLASLSENIRGQLSWRTRCARMIAIPILRELDVRQTSPRPPIAGIRGRRFEFRRFHVFRAAAFPDLSVRFKSPLRSPTAARSAVQIFNR